MYRTLLALSLRREYGVLIAKKCTAPCLQGVSKEFVLIARQCTARCSQRVAQRHSGVRPHWRITPNKILLLYIRYKHLLFAEPHAHKQRAVHCLSSENKLQTHTLLETCAPVKKEKQRAKPNEEPSQSRRPKNQAKKKESRGGRHPSSRTRKLGRRKPKFHPSKISIFYG